MQVKAGRAEIARKTVEGTWNIDEDLAVKDKDGNTIFSGQGRNERKIAHLREVRHRGCPSAARRGFPSLGSQGEAADHTEL